MRVVANIVGTVVVLGLLGSFLLPSVSRTARPAGRRTQCLNNLHNIGIALDAYYGEFGTYPPACAKDADGKPIHSWRAFLLPYLSQEISKAYRFDEPWDGPNNRKLHDIQLDIFRCPEDGAAGTTTSYVAVVGPGTVWGEDAPRDSCDRDSWDSLSQTIRVAEMTNSGIHWLEPRDLPFAEIASTINSKTGRGISSRHPGIAPVLFADGRAKTLSENLTPAIVRALLTVKGGDHVSDQDY